VVIGVKGAAVIKTVTRYVRNVREMEQGNESKLLDVLTDYLIIALLISAHFIYLFIYLFNYILWILSRPRKSSGYRFHQYFIIIFIII